MNSSRKESLFSFLLVLAGVGLLYGRTLSFGFVWDDHIEVLGNDVFHHASNLGRFFTVPYWNLLTGGFAPYHRPMIPVMILTVSTFFGKNPFGYHLLNLILYTFTCWVFYLTMRRLPVKRWIAVTAAAIFLIHPVHAEAVSWGSARPVLLSGLCFITCLYFSLRASSAEQKTERFLYLSALFFFFSVGLLSYHSILTLAPLVFLSDFFNPAEQKKSWSLRLTEYAGYALLGIGFIAFCLFLFHRMGETDLRPLYNGSTANLFYEGKPFENLLAFINTVTRYSELLLFPMNLIPDPAFAASDLSLSACGAFLFIAVISIGLSFEKSSRKLFGFSVLWMFCGLLTVANFIPQGGLFADRYSYIASMGFSLWAALALKAFENYLPSLKSRNLASLLIASLLILWSLKTVTYSGTWKNEFTFWLEASILSPDKPRTHDKLGILLAAEGHDAEAVKEYEKVIALNPGFIMTYSRMAASLRKLGRIQEADAAQKHFDEAMKTARENYKPGEKTNLLALSN